MSDEKPRVLAVSISAQMGIEMSRLLRDQAECSIETSYVRAEERLATEGFDVVVIDFSNDGLPPELVMKAVAAPSSPKVIVLIDSQEERMVQDERELLPIGVWSIKEGALGIMPMNMAFAEPTPLLRLHVILMLAVRQTEKEEREKKPSAMLDEAGIYRLLQMIHFCWGFPHDWSGKSIKARWTQLRPLAKVADQFDDIGEVEGTIVDIVGSKEEGVHFPLRGNVSSLIVRRDDGVEIAIPYNAFLLKGVEVEFELPTT